MSEDHGEAGARDEMDLKALLQRAGARPRPPAHVTEAVRASVAAEWRQVVAAQAHRRRARLALVAGLAVAVFGAWLGWPEPAEPLPVATISRVVGTVERSADPVEGRRWQRITAESPLYAAEELATGHDGLAALRLPAGLSIRLDRDTQVTLSDADTLRIRRGAVYVDSGAAGAGAGALRLETPFGLVRHLGTRYETRIGGSGLILRVRAGQVELSRPGQAIRADAGEQLSLASDGTLQRQPLAADDAAWRWVEEIAPHFDIEDRTLGEFLEWVGHETGLEIRFATPELAAEAAQIRLRGSVAGLSPRQALEAVMATTPYATAAGEGQLRVRIRTPAP